jgi:hypothetical protein
MTLQYLVVSNRRHHTVVSLSLSLSLSLSQFPTGVLRETHTCVTLFALVGLEHESLSTWWC